MRNLLGRLLAHQRTFILACAWVLGWFQFLMCALVAELNLDSVLSQLAALVPPVMRGALEQVMLGGSVQGVLAFAWDHPITHALLAAVAIALAARAIAGEVENGGIELVLAQPLGRGAYLGAHALFALGALVFVIGAGGLGTAIGERVFHIKAFGADRLLRLLLDALLLQLALYGITLLASAWGREAGRVASTGVLVAVVSYFVNVLTTFWPRVRFLEPYSLHAWYDPRAILVSGQNPMKALTVLATVAVASGSLAYWRFARRDLP